MAGLDFKQMILNLELFEKTVVKKTMEKSAIFTSGIVERNSLFDKMASESATLHDMPYYEDLTGDPEPVIEGKDLTADSIKMGKDVCTTLRFAKMWSATDLSRIFADTDPMGVMANLTSDYWARVYQTILLKTLTGVFSSTEMKKSHLVDSSKAKIDAKVLLDGMQVLGDAKSSLKGIIMHSATHNALLKDNLIATVKPSDGSADIPTYLGKRVIIDDSCPYDTSNQTYTTYLFGEGAFAFGNGNPEGFVPVATDRKETMGSGVSFLINRKTIILHPRGVKWTDTNRANKESVTYAELVDPTNWQKVYDNKSIRMVAIQHKV